MQRKQIYVMLFSVTLMYAISLWAVSDVQRPGVLELTYHMQKNNLTFLQVSGGVNNRIHVGNVAIAILMSIFFRQTYSYTD